MVWFTFADLLGLCIFAVGAIFLILIVVWAYISAFVNKWILGKKLFYYNWIPSHGHGREEFHWFKTLEEAEELNEELRADICREAYNY